jgi:DNA polymerase I-like protein with 3'-5' exonuclease and polymerase domains
MTYDILKDTPMAPPHKPALIKRFKNIKELFLPEDGYIVGDADLAQADARVVAWDAEDETLKEIFNDPSLDLHTENAKTIFGSCPTKNHPNRKKAKAGVHAVNYHVFPQTLAKTLGITVLEAEYFIRRWFEAHPKIKAWHDRIYHEMMVEKKIRNAFGFEKKFFGPRDSPTALSEALAWIPQSTVAIIINKVWMNIEKLDPSDIYVTMQTHDSVNFEIYLPRLPSTALDLEKCFEVYVPYADPLHIPGTLGLGKNYGNLVDTTWDGFIIDDETGLATPVKSPYWL